MFEDVRQQAAASIMNPSHESTARFSTASQALNSKHQAVRDEVKGKSKRRNSSIHNFAHTNLSTAAQGGRGSYVRSLHGRNETAKVVFDTGVLPRKYCDKAGIIAGVDNLSQHLRGCETGDILYASGQAQDI